MEILEAFDLTGSYRDAAELAGCDHHTVARYVTARQAGGLAPSPLARDQLIDPHLGKLEEWVEPSRGKLRADVAHDKLVALGYRGSERTTRRAVAAAKQAFWAGHRRVHRPWVPEPGMWLQWDYGAGPLVAGRATQLFCAWLAWSRYRVVLPIVDKTLPTVIACIDQALRRLGGAPTYGLSDNEKTATLEHVAGIAVRNPDMVAAARHYGLTVATCVPADPSPRAAARRRCGSPRRTWCQPKPTCWASTRVWGRWSGRARVQRAGQRPAPPGDPPGAGGGAGGGADPAAPAARPPVHAGVRPDPHGRADHPDGRLPGRVLLGTAHPCGADGVGPRPQRGGRGRPRRPGRAGRGRPPSGDHPGQPPGRPGPLPTGARGCAGTDPAGQSAAEAEFLAIGEGAAAWLTEAGAAGTPRVRVKMAQAVALAKLHGAARVSWALGHAAVYGRFAERDLAQILAHQAAAAPGATRHAGPDHTLQAGTAAWEGFGQ